MSYAARAVRFLSDRLPDEMSSTTHCDISEISEKSPLQQSPAVWWDDRVPEGSVPILHLPPRNCHAPRVCSRLGPCERHAGGAPCLNETTKETSPCHAP
jgi:hypothetical protein